MNVMKGSFEGEEGPGSENVRDSRVLKMNVMNAFFGRGVVTVGRVNTARLLDMCGNHG
jgi:hypothetical protein